MTFIKLDQADLDSPCQEFSNGRLEIAAAFTFFFRNYFFVCLFFKSNPAVDGICREE